MAEIIVEQLEHSPWSERSSSSSEKARGIQPRYATVLRKRVEATVVLSIDAWRTGETRSDTDMNSREFEHSFGDSNAIMTAFLIGTTMAGKDTIYTSRFIYVPTSQ